MKAYLIKMFGISLALTILVELPVAFVLRWGMKHLGRTGKKTESTSNGGRQARKAAQATVSTSGGRTKPALGSKRHLALLVVLVNLLTNPLAVLLCWLGRMYLPPFLSLPVQLLAEAAVVAVEAWIYRSFMEKPGWQTGRPVLLSLTANVCSWTIGIVCGRWIDLAVAIALRLGQGW